MEELFLLVTVASWSGRFEFVTSFPSWRRGFDSRRLLRFLPALRLFDLLFCLLGAWWCLLTIYPRSGLTKAYAERRERKKGGLEPPDLQPRNRAHQAGTIQAKRQRS